MEHKTGFAPNILLIMADQMAAPALPVYGHPITKAPHLEALAASGVVFDAAYCNFPICAPSRQSMLTGRYASAIGAFDNACEFPASNPTLVHRLGLLGYHTSLAGKMHFVGPDQLHGYAERLTTDIIGADFVLTPDWRDGEHSNPAGATVRMVLQSGSCRRSLQIDYDDEVEHCALQKLWDLARAPQARPFFLTVSFTHPHSPYTASQAHWARYEGEAIDLPSVPAMALERMDAMSRWLQVQRHADRVALSDEQLRTMRRAYYAMISYVDDKLGRIRDVLTQTGLDRDTVVIFLADHGEMAGERGMWFKSSFFEWSARVPMIVSWPGHFVPRREPRPVSLIDLLPTLLELGSGEPPAIEVPIDGHSLVPLLRDPAAGWTHPVIAEFTGEGVRAPCRMLRRGRYKYIYTHGHPDQLYDLAADPKELSDLSAQPGHADLTAALRAQALRDWHPDEITREVLASQQRRLLVQRALRAPQSAATSWAYRARADDERRYVRTGKASDAKARKRFPYIEPPA
ncbi:MAG: choline-sulfatase [Burkholderiales bacterium]|nr:choline-sulfatase [Burkholderiales bacterium]